MPEFVWVVNIYGCPFVFRTKESAEKKYTEEVVKLRNENPDDIYEDVIGDFKTTVAFFNVDGPEAEISLVKKRLFD